VSACDELRQSAAGLAALPAGDPEREAFLAHARGCPGCMEAFREGEKVVSALSGVRTAPPSAAALQRASEAILADLRPSHWPLRSAAAVLAFAIPVLFARHRDWEGLTAALLVLALATALSATAGVLRAGAWVALAAAAGFAVAAGGIPGMPGGSGAGFASGIGIDCMALELLGGAVASGILLLRLGPRGGSLATTAAAGALAAQAALHLTCSANDSAPHLWVFHVGGVLLAAVAGWTLQQRLYASSARS
jgi:hypothetical protein